MDLYKAAYRQQQNNLRQLHQLWSMMCTGDEQAFADLYAITFPRLYQYGLRFLAERQVEDALQELYLDVWHQRAKLSHVSSPQAYLFRSLRNRLFNQYKKDQRYQLIPLRESPDFLYEINPLTEVDDSYLKQQLQKAINRLSNQQREVIYLLYFHEMKAEEVAKILNIQVRTVYNTSFNAIRKLRTELEKGTQDFYSMSSVTILVCYFFN